MSNNNGNNRTIFFLEFILLRTYIFVLLYVLFFLTDKLILRFLLSSVPLCRHVIVYSLVDEHFCLFNMEIRNEVVTNIH